uniref:Uncharacterized protein n=1 Tax=Trichinella nativa TaxID=6335 RepID=A0A0V1KIN7_9BILA
MDWWLRALAALQGMKIMNGQMGPHKIAKLL